MYWMRDHTHRSGRSGVEDASSRGTPGGGGGVGKTTLVQMQQGATPSPAARDPGQIQQTTAAGVNGAGGALPHANQIQSSFGPEHDVSSIRAHVGGAAATAAGMIGAEAYATGDNVAFASAPSLHTAAHEAAHVVQQRGGVQLLGGVGHADDAYEQHADAVADRVVAGRSAADLLPKGGGAGGSGAVQMRRLPSDTAAMLANPAGPNFVANIEGTRRAIAMAETELDAAQRAQVDTTARGALLPAAFAALPEATRLTRRLEAIRTLFPALTLGDPMLIDTGPRPGTADTANLTTLVGGANTIFAAIAAGTHDASIGQVFGPANVAAAKTKYTEGRTWMNTLHGNHHIVTDRSGYNSEVGLGGLTGFQTQIALSPNTIDSPAAAESVITMIHESMHAGNSDVSDKGYIGTQVFTQLPEDVKLTNAAHFEVVPRRILGAGNAYTGVTFTPAGAAPVAGGAAPPPLTATQVAVRAASEQIRRAWTLGLNLHTQYDVLYKSQAEWDTPRLGGSFHQGLPYWSKVERMTIHLKTVTEPASADPARRPISQTDMALSEGVTRRLALLMGEIGRVPNDDAAATTFLNAHAMAPEVTAGQATPDAHRDLWIKVALRRIGGLMGPEDRDVRVVHELDAGLAAWSTLLTHRDPGSFAD